MAKHINLQPILDQLKLEGNVAEVEANYKQQLEVIMDFPHLTQFLVFLISYFVRIELKLLGKNRNQWPWHIATLLSSMRTYTCSVSYLFKKRINWVNFISVIMQFV